MFIEYVYAEPLKLFPAIYKTNFAVLIKLACLLCKYPTFIVTCCNRYFFTHLLKKSEQALTYRGAPIKMAPAQKQKGKK